MLKKLLTIIICEKFGFETPALFRHYAKLTMNEIMERYLLRIYSKFFEYDPLSSVDYTETYKREITGEAENTGKSTSSSNSNSSGLNVNSDTPEGQINKQEVLNGKYASSVNASELDSNVNDETNTENNATSKTIETYTHEMKGDNGVIVTNQYLIREFREIIIAVDEEIINELNILFMGLY